MGWKGAMQQPLDDGTLKDGEILAEIVSVLQKRNISGTNGNWKDFLVNTPDVPSGRHDPFLCKRRILASFLDTITDKEHLLMVRKLYSWMQTKHRMEEELEESNGNPEKELVQLTWTHPRFLEDYNFNSHGEGWIQIEAGEISDCSGAPLNLLSLDCEMVDCEGGISEVVHISLVDRTLKTRIDTRVRPSRRVVDYKTHITGVSAEDLEPVTVTQADVQKQVKELLVPGTIMVGHSLHHDLKALKIDYTRLIDTQYLFWIDGRPRIGLRDLCKAVLGYDFRKNGEPHNCLEDATVPMKLVLHRLQHGATNVEPNKMVDEGLLSKLFLHKIPTALTAEDLRSLFPDFSCQIQEVEKAGRKAGGKAVGKQSYTLKYAAFENKDDANEAFSRLSGGLEKDISGRLQKAVSVTLKVPGRRKRFVIMVRKMAFEDNADSQQQKTMQKGKQSTLKSHPITSRKANANRGLELRVARRKEESKKRRISLEQYAESLGLKP